MEPISALAWSLEPLAGAGVLAWSWCTSLELEVRAEAGALAWSWRCELERWPEAGGAGWLMEHVDRWLFVQF